MPFYGTNFDTIGGNEGIRTYLIIFSNNGTQTKSWHHNMRYVAQTYPNLKQSIYGHMKPKSRKKANGISIS